MLQTGIKVQFYDVSTHSSTVLALPSEAGLMGSVTIAIYRKDVSFLKMKEMRGWKLQKQISAM